MEARSGRVTLNTQNGGSYSRIRVMLIDVAICKMIATGHRLAWTHHIIEMIHQQDGVEADAGTELDLPPSLNHLWTEPPLQHEDTGRAKHVIESGMVGQSPGLSAYGVF